MGNPRTKTKIIRAIDVKWFNLYLFRFPNGSLEPCTVICTEHEGWPRGFVKLDHITTGGIMPRAMAQVKAAMSDSIAQVMLERPDTGESWVFTYEERPTLFDYSPSWLSNEIAEANRKIRTAQQRLQQLAVIREMELASGQGKGS